MIKAVAGIAVTFMVVGVAIVAASHLGYVTPQLAMLLLVALLGMYLGFGILFAVYRFTSKLK